MALSRPFSAFATLATVFGDRTTDLYHLDLWEATQPSALASSSLISRAVRELGVNDPLMCGTESIRKVLQLGPETPFNVEQVKTIRYDDAFDSANNYIEKKKEEETRLAAELKELEAKWYQASTEAQAGKPQVPDDDVRSALAESMNAKFETIEKAKDIDCSMLPEDADGEDPFEGSMSDFETRLGAAMGVEQHSKLDKGKVTEICIDVLKLTAANPKTSTCEDLCDKIGYRAASVSSRLAAKFPTQGELLQQIQEKRSQIDSCKAAIKDCEITAEGIRTYSGQLKAIVAEHDLLGKTQRELKGRLTAIMKSLELSSRQVTSETETLEQLMTLLGATKEKDQDVQDQIKANLDEQHELDLKQEEVKQDLLDLKQHLTLTEQSVRAMQAFKASMVLAMQSFVQIYDDAIRRPLRDSGITKVIEAASDDMFPQVDSAAATVWAEPGTRMTTLESDCKALASKSKSFCALSPVESDDAGIETSKQDNSMCNMGEALQATCDEELTPKDYVDSVREAVVARQTDVKTWIAGLKSEIENLVDRPMVNKANGEPEWLRRFASVLPTTKFYQDFVTKWYATGENQPAPESWSGEEDKVGQGVVLTMLKVMDAIETQMKSKVAYTTGKLKELADQLVRALKRDADLRQKLAEFEKALTEEEAQRIQYSTKLEEYEKQLAEKEGERQRLQKQLDMLILNFKEMESNLASTFRNFEGSARSNFKATSEEADELVQLSKSKTAEAKSPKGVQEKVKQRASVEALPHRQ